MTKKLVVCADGTWNSAADAVPTNVIRLYHLLADRHGDGTEQVAFYDAGVGTAGLLDRVLGGVTGKGIDQNIADAYRFLVERYEEGDELYFFGFSRGAYTVRSAVGFIRKCGLLRPDRLHLLPRALALYRRRDATADPPDVVAFREANARDIASFDFLGVWDTVGSLGIPYGRLRRWTAGLHEFHDVRLSTRVRSAFHAIAIDEDRQHLEPTLWEERDLAEQRVEQTWFAGSHLNVGGGYAHGTELSSITLQWMIDRARECGLAFDDERVSAEVKPSYRGSLGRTPALHRRLGLTGHVRAIGEQSPGTERVHATAYQRMDDATLGYAPANLVAYRAKQAIGR